MIMLRLIQVLLLIHILNGCSNVQKQNQNQINSNNKMEIKKEVFGIADQLEVYLFTLKNIHGTTVKITNYGGIVTSILVPDKDGIFDDVVLGYNDLEGYLQETPYFGAIVGRYANRIANGKFELDGITYNLAINNGPNTLHGGLKGFDKVIWEQEEVQGSDFIGLKLYYLSVDGEEGYPGNLSVIVQYSLTNDNELIIDYTATTDKATPLNLSHHSYFNLAGTSGRNILEQELWIDADTYTIVDETQIPTGELKSVEGPMDFRKSLTVGSRLDEVEGGYDHNYVLNKTNCFAKVAELSDPISGRVMQVFTTEPGMQFYTGNFLDGTITGKKGIVYTKHFGLCLETQHFPDSPNQPEFPNTILRPGEEYKQKTVYKFLVK